MSDLHGLICRRYIGLQQRVENSIKKANVVGVAFSTFDLKSKLLPESAKSHTRAKAYEEHSLTSGSISRQLRHIIFP